MLAPLENAILEENEQEVAGWLDRFEQAKYHPQPYIKTLGLTRELIAWGKADREINEPVVKLVVGAIGPNFGEYLTTIFRERR